MSPPLEKFVDALPILRPLEPMKKTKSAHYYEITMEEFSQQLHRDLPPTRLWGYNAQFPGPLIEVDRGTKVHVEWKNNLPDEHFLPIDQSFIPEEDMPEVRTVVHLHGSESEADSDGFPDSWYTRNYEITGPTFSRKVYEYPNHQRGALLWYHDHAMYITRLNVYAGLVGLYIIRDKEEKKLNLPSGDYEIPLVVLDRTFNDDGTLFYPTGPADGDDNLPTPSVVPAFLGDTILVNGKVWPYLEVEPRKYRFRILNGSNTRRYQFFLDSGQTMYQIGSDGGLMQKTVPIERLSLFPAERADLIIDFSDYAGQTIILKNDLGPNAQPDDETGDIMQFRVTKPLSEPDTSRIPNILSEIPSLTNNPIQTLRYVKLTGSTDEFGRPLLLLDNKKWMVPVTETPRLNDTEVWSIINTTNFPHPIHIHLIQFQVLDRRPFDLDHYNETGEIVYTGSSVPPPENERGWKDTIEAPGGQVTRLIMRFAPYEGDYVWHCHILEHEDYEMMRPLRVIEPRKEKKKQKNKRKRKK